MKFGMPKDEFALEDSSKNETSNVSHASSVVCYEDEVLSYNYLLFFLFEGRYQWRGKRENYPLSALLNWRTRSKVLGDFKEVILNSSHRVQK